MVTENQVVYSHYILAKAALEMKNYGEAEREFNRTAELTSGEFGAESKYQLALINFQKNNLEEAENLIYQIPEQYADFDYWIAKGFILLADIYLARDNSFQAAQTLQSVIDNYPGDDLREEARKKLSTFQTEEARTDSIN
jgi:TolA-binding protein